MGVRTIIKKLPDRFNNLRDGVTRKTDRFLCTPPLAHSGTARDRPPCQCTFREGRLHRGAGCLGDKAGGGDDAGGAGEGVYGTTVKRLSDRKITLNGFIVFFSYLFNPTINKSLYWISSYLIRVRRMNSNNHPFMNTRIEHTFFLE
jgi:hypothetical protein